MVRAQKAFQPLNRFNVQVIGGLIQHDVIGPTQQYFCQLNTHTPASTELMHRALHVFQFKSQSDQGLFHICMDGMATFHIKLFICIGKLLDQ